MAEITSIQFKRGTEAKLIAKLKAGELGVPQAGEPVYATDTHVLKIGDGINEYKNLPAITGGGSGDIDFIIHDPLDDQILYYDSTSNAWLNGNITDLLTGYSVAKHGDMLVKDNTNGLAWRSPVSDATLQAAVAEANQAKDEATDQANRAGNEAVAAARSATQADRITKEAIDKINAKFWWGTLEEYDKLKSIEPDTFYFITVN